MEYLQACPLCGCLQFDTFLHARDYFLTQEQFTIVSCTACGFLFTNPRPLPAELPKYYQSEAYISHSNKKSGLFALLYQQTRLLNLRRKYRLVEKYCSKGYLLDIGCGTGEFLLHGQKKGWQVLGIEPDPKARHYATSVNKLQVLDEAALESLPKQQFDLITMWHVLEHVPQLQTRLQTIQGLLKPDGLLLIAVPNANSLDARKLGKYWAGYDLPRHLYHFTIVSLSKLLQNHKFTIVGNAPLAFDAYYVCLLSSEYRHGRKKYFEALLNGFRSNQWAKRNNQNYSSIILLSKAQKS